MRLWVGGALLFCILAVTVYWLPRAEAWAVLGQLATSAVRVAVGV